MLSCACVSVLVFVYGGGRENEGRSNLNMPPSN